MNEELYQRTIETLVKAAKSLTTEELSLLCWHCGVSYEDVIFYSRKAA